MSVSVSNLIKAFGNQKAVNGISFTANPGEVLGFLGPNGAGKTTTMKIISAFIPQTSGEVSVCGHDVAEEPLEVRRHIGYLPEHNPLYKEMYVKEYLRFVAGLHKVSKPQQVVKEMIEWTGLGREQHKLIGTLSKGYRQRVGLAQAMLHNPDVLILDEPTSGLDPNQLVEIRSLIKKLGEEKTVIFSTHIMQEVQALCDRVVIINKGSIVADDPIENLQKRVSGETIITVEFLQEVAKEKLEKIPHLTGLSQLEKHIWQLKTSSEVDIRAQVFNFAVDNKFTILEMKKEIFSVEDVFQRLTANQDTIATVN